MSATQENAIKFFEEYPESQALKVLEQYRWPSTDGVRCLLCNGWRLYREQRKGKFGFYRCPMPHQRDDCSPLTRQYVFSVRTGTILEHSRVPLFKWLYCLSHVPSFINDQRPISASELALQIGVTRRTAALILELLRTMDHYFCVDRKPVIANNSQPAQRALEKFYAQPEQNEFLMRYRGEMLGIEVAAASAQLGILFAE